MGEGWTGSIVGALVGAIVGSGIVIYAQGQQEQREQAAAVPHLSYANGHRYEKGDTILTYRNDSTSIPAAITSARYTIVDPAILARIAARDPVPEGPFACEAAAPSTALNEVVEVGFTDGYWCREGYVFWMPLGQHLKPREVGDVHLRIDNPKWAGETFAGQLELTYSGVPAHVELVTRLNNVTIYPQNGRP